MQVEIHCTQPDYKSCSLHVAISLTVPASRSRGTNLESIYEPTKHLRVSTSQKHEFHQTSRTVAPNVAQSRPK
jgi:hypothetical protein